MRKRIATILVLALVLSSCNKTEVLETTVTEKTTELTTCEETTVDAGGTITNTYSPETTNVTVIKLWEDDNDRDRTGTVHLRTH